MKLAVLILDKVQIYAQIRGEERKWTHLYTNIQAGNNGNNWGCSGDKEEDCKWD